jgi:hypothetical protein
MSDLVVTAEIDYKEALHLLGKRDASRRELKEPSRDRRVALMGGLPEGVVVDGTKLTFNRLGEDYTLTKERGRYVLYQGKRRVDLGRNISQAREKFVFLFA